MNFDHDLGTIDTILTIDTTSAPPLGGTTGVLNVVGTGGIVLPTGTNGTRPANQAGLLRYSTTSNGPEFNNGSTWSTMGGSVTSIAATGSTGLVVGGSPITTSGTLTFTLGTELQGLSSLAANGVVTRTASGTYAARTVTGTASNIVVTNGDGVSGNPTINLATAGTSVSDQFRKITTDTFGRVTATSAVAAGDITTSLGYTPINKAGDTGIGALTLNSAASITLSGGGTVTGLPSTPAGSTDAASKAYVDSVAQGLDPKPSVRVATVVAGTLASSFANGQTVDGQTLVTGDRILIKNQGTASENGIYTVNVSGAPTRATDMDAWTEVPGAFVFVEIGTQADTGWVCTSNQGGTLNSTAITFTQFSGAGTYSAGTGITLTGTTFSLTSPVTATLGGTGLTSLGTANYVLGVNTAGTALEYKTVTGGTAITVTPTAGTLTITNTGVTSAVAGTGISVSGGTGAVTISNTGVTSVGLSLPSFITVTGSPVTTTGTLTGTLASQTANTAFIAPNGSAGAPTFRALLAADLPFKLYSESISSPTNASATGTNTVAIGSGSVASGTGTLAMGSGAKASIFGQQAVANGRFATDGDAQHGTYVLRNITSNATTTELYLDGVTATQRIVVPNNSVWTFTILVAGRRTDTTGGGAGYRFDGVLRKDATAGSTTLVGAVSKSVLGETNTAWNAAVTVDTTNGSLKVDVTGEAAKTIRWVATVMTTEVTN
jgi:hypothetical protein